MTRKDAIRHILGLEEHHLAGTPSAEDALKALGVTPAELDLAWKD